MSNKGRAFLKVVLLTLVVSACTLGTSGPAFGVHDLCLVELEGDALDDTQPFCTTDDDWAAGTNGNLANAFQPDGFGSFADAAFTQGSQDDEDVGQWRYNSLGANSKGDLEHAFLTAYELADGDVKLYFGGDRASTLGDAGMGISLLQEDVELASGQFTWTEPTDGCHNVGDVLVESEFTNGGGDVTINVYEWVGAGAGDSGSHDELDQLVGGDTGYDCTDLPYNGLRDDPVCATVNDGNTAVPETATEAKHGRTTPRRSPDRPTRASRQEPSSRAAPTSATSSSTTSSSACVATTVTTPSSASARKSPMPSTTSYLRKRARLLQ